MLDLGLVDCVKVTKIIDNGTDSSDVQVISDDSLDECMANVADYVEVFVNINGLW